MHRDHVGLLRSVSMRATSKRLALLATLDQARRPMTAEEIHVKVRGADLVTIYRNLQNLVAVGLVRAVRFKDASLHYESSAHGHHHHIVCTHCGAVDELPVCNVRSLDKEALKTSSRFARISEHSLEFFGLCKKCS